MKTENATQQKTEEILNSLDGISRAEVPPFFFTRLQARLETQNNHRPSWSRITKPALSMAALSLLVILNVAGIDHYVKAKKSNPQVTTNNIQDFAQEYDLSVSALYNDKTNQP